MDARPILLFTYGVDTQVVLTQEARLALNLMSESDREMLIYELDYELDEETPQGKELKRVPLAGKLQRAGDYKLVRLTSGHLVVYRKLTSEEITKLRFESHVAYAVFAIQAPEDALAEAADAL